MLSVSGCIGFSYDGDSFEPTDSAAVYHDAGQIGKPYDVIGRAAVYGNYRDVTGDELERRMASEAEARGAHAVLITASQIVPDGDAADGATYMRSAESADAGRSGAFTQLQRDFGSGYGQADRLWFQPEFNRAPPTARDYRRIIRGVFIRFRTGDQEKEGTAPDGASSP